MKKLTNIAGLAFIAIALVPNDVPAKEAAPDFNSQIAPLLTKYCGGCHNEEEANGDLSLASFAALQNGGESGPAFTPGSAASSRMIQMLAGKLEPKMPPEDEPAPTADEIELLAGWIDAGAPGPDGEVSRLALRAAKIAAPDVTKPITALAYSPDGAILALARFGMIELRSAAGKTQLGRLQENPGKINSLSFTTDGRYLLAGTGVAGLGGEAVLWRVADPQIVRRFSGHRDILYAVMPSPDGRLVATAGYDHRILLWDLDTGERLRELNGHNGAVYDLAFDPDTTVLASASADATVKVWRVADGMRLDTRSEPLKEQYSTAISPCGRFLVGGGADNRIRVWDLVSRQTEKINPLRHARFAHEAAIELVRFSSDGSLLISVGRDDLIKIWGTDAFQQLGVLPKQAAPVAAVAIASTNDRLAVGRLDGSFEIYPLPQPGAETAAAEPESADTTAAPPIGDRAVGEMAIGTEQEPNDAFTEAQKWNAPFQVTGVVHALEMETDKDLFRFASQRGQTWVVEVKASRDGSPLDSKIEILDTAGRPVPRVVLQAVRDSYFTFRGKNSLQTGDFRLQNWEEMKLNQLLYCNGEVVKLYHYPRGPDSGFNVYPNFGNRHGYFDTTPLAHALHEPCYVVEAHPPGTQLNANGLPTFTLNYENDDDSQRELGADSRLTFVAPDDADYLVCIRDVRGFHGEDYRYELTVRAPQPDFQIRTIHGENPTVPRGDGRKLGIEIDRIDGFEGPVQIQVNDLPAGLSVPAPITIQANHLRTWIRLQAEENTPELTEETARQATVTATARIGDRDVLRSRSLGEIKLADKPKLRVQLTADSGAQVTAAGMPVIEVVAGTTATARLQIERAGYEGRVNFGNEEAAVNAPHGVYVDNIGLNGVLIPEGNTERVFFITAEPWVEPLERIIFLEAAEADRPTSNPAVLRIVRNASAI